MLDNINLCTGRIEEIIYNLKLLYNTQSIASITTQDKLIFLCNILQLEIQDFDQIISSISPVFRTIKGHSFEAIFDLLIIKNGYDVVEVGGDTNIDRIVNGKTLQLKTPYMKKNQKKVKSLINTVAYKTHKTHGAKSEKESMNYYHCVTDFPDYLVGLVSYNPFKILILSKDELPKHPTNPKYILSPFEIQYDNHEALNNFKMLGIDDVDLNTNNYLATQLEEELLPLTCKELLLKTEVIIDVILNKNNFRIWDMSIRGFAREIAFKKYLNKIGVKHYDTNEFPRHRANKADLLLKSKPDGSPQYFQIKGLSINNCWFDGTNSTVTVETQLTRGRVNDHPTQSRLYLKTDFDYLIIAIDPVITQRYHLELGKTNKLEWEFYAIPVSQLKSHRKYQNRLNSMQRFLYTSIDEYKININWQNQWLMNNEVDIVIPIES
jgi:hypothetical protein